MMQNSVNIEGYLSCVNVHRKVAYYNAQCLRNSLAAFVVFNGIDHGVGGEPLETFRKFFF